MSETRPGASEPVELAQQRNDPTFDGVWDELLWRGLVHVSTDAGELKSLLAGPPIVYYCGFDPTAPSLHLGNLVQLLTMRRIQLAGHRPLGLVGGSTGLIGDPRQTAERVLNTKETVVEWVALLRAQVERFLSFSGDAAFDGANAARIVNNLDWTAPLSAIDFLRDIGKYFRVGTMVKKEIVASRLNSDEGISYTEFSYQILQGMDFLHLLPRVRLRAADRRQRPVGQPHERNRAHPQGRRRRRCTPSAPRSSPTATARKFGKSEGNAVWLDPALTSPYAFSQFWLNTDDSDVIARLKVFTFLSRAEIERLEAAVAAEPFRREAQKVLARSVTALVHGEAATDAAFAAAEALFGNGDLSVLDEATLRSAIAELPRATAASGALVAQLLVDAGLTSSVSESRRAIEQGGVYLNNTRVDASDAVIDGSFLPGGLAVLRRGKKTLAGIVAA